MIEKYFEVTKDSGLYEDYNKYYNNVPVLNKIVKDFCMTNGIESKTYACTSDSFYIAPTEKDKENFKTQLCKYAEGCSGITPFKKNSKIGKNWVAQKAVVLNRPFVGLYFEDCCGHTSSRIFKIDDKVYCSYKNENDTMETPKGFVEIKASEFFKIIEDNEDKSID